MIISGKVKLMILTALDHYIQNAHCGPIVQREYDALEKALAVINFEQRERDSYRQEGFEMAQSIVVAQQANEDAEFADLDPEEIAEGINNNLDDDRALTLFGVLADRFGVGVTWPTEPKPEQRFELTVRGLDAALKASEEPQKADGALTEPEQIDEVFGEPEHIGGTETVKLGLLAGEDPVFHSA
jgi:hypothetical protein